MVVEVLAAEGVGDGQAGGRGGAVVQVEAYIKGRQFGGHPSELGVVVLVGPPEEPEDGLGVRINLEFEPVVLEGPDFVEGV